MTQACKKDIQNNAINIETPTKRANERKSNFIRGRKYVQDKNIKVDSPFHVF